MAKMSTEKKMKLIYAGEFLLFAVVFIVIGILKLLGFIGTNSTYRLIFSIITSCGALFMTGDFIFSLVNEKRRAKVCLLDKIILLPVACFLIVYNILSFCHIGGVIVLPELFFKISMGSVLFYLSGSYGFQGIYHYFVPTKEFLEALEEDAKEKAKKLEEAKKVEEEKQESESNDQQ